LSAFEDMYGMSSEDMLACVEGDERISKINPFELMDWHYALEQVAAFSTVVDIDATDTESSPCIFRYKSRGARELVNAAEPELLLVA
jgi:hemerythrin superfamily protein